MTLKDIAAQAGVSVSTVSRIINNRDNSYKCSSPIAEERVWEAVRRSGYIPNQSAKELKQKRGKNAKSMDKKISCLFAKTERTITEQFFSPIAIAVEQEVLAQGYALGYSLSLMNVTELQTERLRSVKKETDGIVVLGRLNDEQESLLIHNYKNIVAVGIDLNTKLFDCIHCDGHLSATLALDYLAELGHQEIGYMGLQDVSPYDAYFDFFTERGWMIKEGYICQCISDFEAAYETAKAFFINRKERIHNMTALFCSSDTIAIGTMRACKELNIRIPEDISIIGIDNIEMAQLVSPMLTTVDVPKKEMGQLAVKILMDRIGKGHKSFLNIEFPCKLVKRESCRSI